MKGVGRQKKILHIITGLNDGGAEGVLTRLCLHSKYVRHVVISMMDEGKYGAILKEAGIAVYCLSMNSGRFSLIKFFKLMRLVRTERPDVVQTWMYHADLLGGLAARLVGVQRVFWGVRHSELEYGKVKRSTILVARICAMLSRWVPKKIICCANKALIVHSDIGYKKSKLTVIHNGYDLLQFKPNSSSRSALRQELQITEDEFLIGKVGRFDLFKDHINLLQALAIVAKQNVNYRCLLVGHGLTPDNEALMLSITGLGLQNHIILGGQRNDIASVMNALDLHVLSSSSEGFPNVLAEAMACGTPCVTTDVGDALEIVGDIAICCPARDPQALAGVIIRMNQEWRNNSENWKDRKAFVLKRIQDNFSIHAMVVAYETCWFDS